MAKRQRRRKTPPAAALWNHVDTAFIHFPEVFPDAATATDPRRRLPSGALQDAGQKAPSATLGAMSHVCVIHPRLVDAAPDCPRGRLSRHSCASLPRRTFSADYSTVVKWIGAHRHKWAHIEGLLAPAEQPWATWRQTQARTMRCQRQKSSYDDVSEGDSDYRSPRTPQGTTCPSGRTHCIEPRLNQTRLQRRKPTPPPRAPCHKLSLLLLLS